jgi:hypothetical protein
MKKLFTPIIFIFLCALFSAGLVYAATLFMDSATHKYKNAIEYIRSEGIVEGYADGTYKPDSAINRAELVKIVIEMMFDDEDITNCQTANTQSSWSYIFFPDIDIDSWYAKYICMAKTNGIIQGYPDGTFKPSNNVNFVEALKIIELAYGADLSESSVWYQAYVNEASSKNLIPLDIVSFDQKITRGQMADMITRYLKYKDGTQAEYLSSSFGTDGSKVMTYDTISSSSASGNLPPAAAIDACTGKTTGDSCEFSDKGNTAQGTCDTKPGILACAPDKSGQTASSGNTSVSADISEYASCINNTTDAPECKDCCDCLEDSDGDTRTACRDTCAVHDFSGNSDFITVVAPSTLGATGDYSECVAEGSSGDCKACCEGSLGLMCGDYQYCRTACNEAFGTTSGPSISDQSSSNYYDSSKTDSEYNIEQAISDRAQETTIAYDALAFLTGNTCADSFIPPGKVADFFGYQYLRDATPDGMGHNTDFVTNSANNVLYILSDTQKQKMIDLATTQIDEINQYAYDRYPLMVAFRRQLEGDIPSGTSGLSKEAVISYSEDLYKLDAEISIERAKLYAEIIKSLDSDQKEFFDAMVEGGFDSWTPRGNDLNETSLSAAENVLVMTYASEMFGWYAGDVEADTYFCPERHGTYFGSFYMKDAPAMGNAGYTIDETITGNKGETMLTLLTDSQSKEITDLVDLQRTNLNGIVDAREAISTELRKLLIQDSIDEDKVMDLAEQYGAYDGEDVYYYATHFAEVMDTLTDSEKESLMELRDLDNYVCPDANIYRYSERITKPAIENTDFLFE